MTLQVFRRNSHKINITVCSYFIKGFLKIEFKIVLLEDMPKFFEISEQNVLQINF